MERVTHKGFNIASSIIVYNAAAAIHVPLIGKPVFWDRVALSFASPDLMDHLFSWAFVYRLTFYFCVIGCSSLPDDAERSGLGNLFGWKHRGYTHSCFGLLTFSLLAGFLVAGLVLLLTFRGFPVPPPLVNWSLVAIVSCLIGGLLHVLADMCTIRKVQIMYPVEEGMSLQLGTNESVMIHGIVWLLFALVAALLVAHVLGL